MLVQCTRASQIWLLRMRSITLLTKAGRYQVEEGRLGMLVDVHHKYGYYACAV